MSYTKPFIAFQLLSIPQLFNVSSSVRLSLEHQLSKNNKDSETEVIIGVNLFKFVSSLKSMLLSRGIILERQ